MQSKISRSRCIIYILIFGVGEVSWEKFIWDYNNGFFFKKDYAIKLFLNKCFSELDLDLISELKDLEKWVYLFFY